MDIEFRQHAHPSAERRWKQEEPVASGQWSVTSKMRFCWPPIT